MAAFIHMEPPIDVMYIATRRGVVAAAHLGRSEGAHANAKALKHKAAKAHAPTSRALRRPGLERTRSAHTPRPMPPTMPATAPQHPSSPACASASAGGRTPCILGPSREPHP
eukprot:scaffold87983_cov75-Phaeocystis_antarctica.AAC.5